MKSVTLSAAYAVIAKRSKSKGRILLNDIKTKSKVLFRGTKVRISEYNTKGKPKFFFYCRAEVSSTHVKDTKIKHRTNVPHRIFNVS